MIASAHLAYGAACGIIVQKYLPVGFGKESRCAVALVAGLVSHMILDAWPHWEYPQHGFELLAILLVETSLVSIGIFSAKRSQTMNIVIFCGMVGGAVPDPSLVIWEKLFFWEPLLYFHFVTHIFHSSLPFFEISWLFQMVLTVLAMVYIQWKSA